MAFLFYSKEVLLLHNALNDALGTIFDDDHVNSSCIVREAQLHLAFAHGNIHLGSKELLAVDVGHFHLVGAFVAAVAACNFNVEVTIGLGNTFIETLVSSTSAAAGCIAILLFPVVHGRVLKALHAPR